MDDVDIRILQAMGIRRFGTTGSNLDDLKPVNVARRVGLDPATVRARLRRMEETGFVRGYDVLPNLRVLGLREVAVMIPIPPAARARAFEKLRLVDGLVEVHEFFRGPICVDFTYRTDGDLARRLELLRELLGAEAIPVCEGAMPELGAALSTTDLRVLRALRGHALRPEHDIARELGVATKTVRRRIAHLTRANAYFAMPILDPAKGGGLDYAALLVNVPHDAWERVAAAVFAALVEHAFFYYQTLQGRLYVLCLVHTPAEVDEIAARAARVPGVSAVEAHLLQRVENRTAWIDGALDDAIAARGARDVPIREPSPRTGHAGAPDVHPRKPRARGSQAR